MPIRTIRRIITWWNSLHPDRALERAIPAFAEAARRERRARARNCTQEIGAALEAKREAVHAALAGKAVR
jgi:hypothetical protein